MFDEKIKVQWQFGDFVAAPPSWENQDKMITVLQDPDQWLNENTGLPDAILVSAGGDDLVGDQLALYLDYGGGGLNLKRYQGVLDSVQASYCDLFAFRDIFAKNVPIIPHCHDYAIPNDVHPVCAPSAWLWPSFNFAGYDYDDGLQIVTRMIDSCSRASRAMQPSEYDAAPTWHDTGTTPVPADATVRVALSRS